MKFARSLSVPGPDDIPPPPTTAPPDPPFSSAPPLGWRAKSPQQSSVSVSQSTSTAAHYQPYSQPIHFTHGGRERVGGPSAAPGGGAVDHTTSYAHAASHAAQSRTASRKVAYTGDPVGAGMGAGGGAKSAAALRRGYSTAVPASSIATVIPQQQQTTPSQPQRAERAAGGPKGGARRGKGPLVKQSKVEDLRAGQGTLGDKGSVEKSSIPIPTIIVKAPSTSSSGRSSQGSSVEADVPTTGDADEGKAPHSPPSTPAPQPPAPPSIPAPPPPSLPSLRSQENLDYTSQFGAAIVGAARRDRERFHEARRKSASLFMSAEEDVSLTDGLGGGTRTQVLQQQMSTQADGSARLRPSKSIDEGMFSGETFIHHTRSMPPAFGLPEYSSPALDYQPKSVPTDLYTAAGRQPLPSTSTTFIHPLTGKALDPTSPLGLALAARERALRDDGRLRRGVEHHFSRQMSTSVFPSSASASQPPSVSAAQSSGSSYLVTSSSLAATTATMGRPPSPRILRGLGNVWSDDGGGVDREREGGVAREGLRVRFSEDKTVHTHHYQPQSYQASYKERERERSRERDMSRVEQAASADSLSQRGAQTQPPQRPSFLRMESQSEAYILSLTPASPPASTQQTGTTGTGLMVLPPPAPSVDADDEFVYADPLPPPLEFANSFDKGLGRMSAYSQQRILANSLASHQRQVPPPPPPPPPPPQKEPFMSGFPAHTPLPSPQAGDSTASSLTSYDSEVANLTQSVHSPCQTSPNPPPPTSPSTLQPNSIAAAPPPPSVSPPPPPGTYHRPFSMSHPHHLYNSSHAPGRSSPTPPLHTVAPPPAYRGAPVPSSSSASLRSAASHATTASCTATTTAAATTTSTSAQLYQERTHTTHTSSTSIMGSRRTGEHHRPPPTTKKGESLETVVDSGIEELDSRSSSDHHLDSILALRGDRLDRGDRGGGAGGRAGGGGGGTGESERGGDFLESYMSYFDGQTFEMQNATAVSSTYPKASRFRDGGRVGELQRQTSTAPPSYHTNRQQEDPEEEEGEEGAEDGGGHDSYGGRDLARPMSPYFERPCTPEMKPLWGEGQMSNDGGQSAAGLEGKKMYPSSSSMKPTMINELSNKLQQRSKESWSSQRPLSRHRC